MVVLAVLVVRFALKLPRTPATRARARGVAGGPAANAPAPESPDNGTAPPSSPA